MRSNVDVAGRAAAGVALFERWALAWGVGAWTVGERMGNACVRVRASARERECVRQELWTRKSMLRV